MPAEVASTASLPGLSPVAGKPIVARFDGGLLSSDGGLLALREIEHAARVAGCIADPRVTNQPSFVKTYVPMGDDAPATACQNTAIVLMDAKTIAEITPRGGALP
jgi:hypothetical protein